MMRGFVAALLFAFLALLPVAEEEEVLFGMDMLVNFDGNFANYTWVPIDVFVKNDQEDFVGTIEVRLYSGDSLQSPIYSIPADSPKGSDKRWRVYAKLNSTTRVSANFYVGNRPVMPVPSYQDILPAPDHDLMALLLTEDPADLGFLNGLLAASDPGDKPRRLFRKWLHTDYAQRLPENPLCYEPYTFIFIDEFMSERVSPSRRAAIERYVRGGGVLVVMTGAHAGHHRGTWVEALTGVSMGTPTLVKESELIAVFEERARVGASEGKTYPIAPIRAMEDASRVVEGAGHTLAVLRPLGRGYVATFAIDAKSKGLQSCKGYKDLWADILLHEESDLQLSFDGAVPRVREWLFNLAGIQMFSRTKVFGYLMTYVAVGIVGAWLLANYLKRREWAWGIMCVASIAFTGYALIFGTAGRATTTEVERVSFIQTRDGSTEARLDTMLGIVSPRTRAYDIPLEGKPLGVSPGDFFDDGGFAVSDDSRAFRLLIGEPSTITDYRIGASDIRLLRITEEFDVPGPLTSSLVFDEGEISGSVWNESGYVLERPLLFYDGHIYSGFGGDRRIRFPRYPDADVEGAFNNQWRHPDNHDYYKWGIVRTLVGRLPDAQATAYCVGWVGRTSLSTVMPDVEDVATNVEQSLLIAEVSVDVRSHQTLETRVLSTYQTVGYNTYPAPSVSERRLIAHDWDAPGSKTIRTGGENREGQARAMGNRREDEVAIDVYLSSAEIDEGGDCLYVEFTARPVTSKHIVLRIEDPTTGESSTVVPSLFVDLTDWNSKSAYFKVANVSRYSTPVVFEGRGSMLSNPSGEPLHRVRLKFDRSSQPEKTRKHAESYGFTAFTMHPTISKGVFPAWP